MKNQCQSCGLPLKKDPKGGGTMSDGSLSSEFCSYCYEQGEFLQPDWSAKDMQQFVKGKMQEMGFPGFIARIFTRKIPKLARWSNT